MPLNDEDYNENTYKEFLISNIDLIDSNIKFPYYFIHFTNQIEQTLNEYIKKNKLNKVYILCTSKISSIIGTYFELLSKSKCCEFINLIDFDDKFFDIISKNYKNMIFMDYISQGDNLTHITKILDYLELSNDEDITNRYHKSNIKIIKIIKKIRTEIEMDEKTNTDPITDEEFNFENKFSLNGNFLNLYDFINISSINILNKDFKNPYMLIKLLVLTYIYKDIYLKILLKYEKKINLFENKIQIGGTNNFLKKYSGMSYDEFRNLCKYKYIDIIYFVEACNKIEKCFADIKTSRKLNELYVLCPGDSPFKFYAYFSLLEKCKFCKFISFPFSRPKSYDKHTTYEYLNRFLPNDYSNIVIMDSIDRGETMNMIIDSMEIKNSLIENKQINKNNSQIIEKIKISLKNFLDKKTDYDTQDNPVIKNVNCENKYIINLYNFINLSMEETLFVSEKENVRCLESYSNHSKHIESDKYKDIQDLILEPNSSRYKKYSPNVPSYIGDDMYNSACLYYIREYCIAGLYWNWYSKLEFKS